MQTLENTVYPDLRGHFSEFWNCRTPLIFVPQSAATSYNAEPGTLRGLHFQSPPNAQSKLIYCSHGRVFDVVLDLRPDSPTYLQWQGEELDGFSGKAIHVPKGCAHGFLTLEPNSVMTYLIEGPYVPEASGIIRWNDPCHGISWPTTHPILSERDQNAPDYIS